MSSHLLFFPPLDRINYIYVLGQIYSLLLVVFDGDYVEELSRCTINAFGTFFVASNYSL